MPHDDTAMKSKESTYGLIDWMDSAEGDEVSHHKIGIMLYG